MEDSKLNGQKLSKKRLSVPGCRRSGFMLVMALIVVLLGTALSVGIFALANSMHTTNIVNRRSYEDQIDVTRHIEQAKGFIVAQNIARVSADRPVLHGRGASTDHYFAINSLEDLQVCTPAAVGDVLSREIPLVADRGFARRLRLRVYDANYQVDDVFFEPDSEMPPSLRPPVKVVAPVGVDAYEKDGEEESGENQDVSGDVVIADYYKYFGAYLIRAEVFREGQTLPLRRTEEAFFQVVRPANAPAP